MHDSILTKKQVKTFRVDFLEGDDNSPVTLIAKVRYDDECGNGHNTFAITGERYEKYHHPGESTIEHKNGRKLWMSSCGCLHDEIAEHFPELAPLIKWHLCSSDGPMHYLANTLYFADDRDHWGLRKGEFRQHTSSGQQNGGVPGIPRWEVKLPKHSAAHVYASEKPAPIILEWTPSGVAGEGKARELDKARSAAIWPDATDEELTAPGLKDRLEARLPTLMAEFRAAVESLGFTW